MTECPEIRARWLALILSTDAADRSAYLRLCFTFGGFPGYEGTDAVPAEIEALRAGLLEF